MEPSFQPEKRSLLKRLPSTLKSKPLGLFLLVLATLGIGGWLVFSDSQATATTNGIWISIDEVKKLPMSGPAWANVKTAADKLSGKGDIGKQESDHDIYTYAASLVYARTGDESYRKKAADAVMSAVGTEDNPENSTLTVGWDMTAYVVAADLINLPQYNASMNTTFSNWIRALRTKKLGSGLKENMTVTHEGRSNNWGTGNGSSRIAIDIYLNDRADLDRASKVFRGFMGDRAAYSDFKDLSSSSPYRCDNANLTPVTPANCTKNGVLLSGALPEELRRAKGGETFKYPPAYTSYVWTALEGLIPQGHMLSRQGYDAKNWSNQGMKRTVEFLYQASKKDGNFWASGTDDKWIPWLINSMYGSNYPTSNNGEGSGGRVMNYTDWTHANRTNTPPPSSDTQAPNTPTNFKALTNVEKNVQLAWTPSTDNVAVTRYELRRNNEVLGNPTSSAFTDTSAAANTSYIYTVKAFDAAGNASSVATLGLAVVSNGGDKNPPSASVTQPANNAVVTTESTPITFNVTDDVKLVKAEVHIDGDVEGTVPAVVGKNSYKVAWNTKVSGSGKHTVQIWAYDTAGNIGKSPVHNVTVQLPGTPPPPPSGATLTFTAVSDARMSQNNATKNYGGEDFLRIRNNGNESWRSIVKFDVNGLSGPPKSVKLRLFATDGGPDAGTLFATSNDWNEGTINWNTTPINANIYRVGKSASVSVNDRSWAEWDLTAWIRNNGQFTYGITSDNDNSVYYTSREGSNKPTLVIVK